MDRPGLSVVVPAHENASALDATLRSLTRQTLPSGDFEVVVGDDGSAVALGPVVDAYRDRLRIDYVRSERNRGRSANRNAAAARARADTLMFLDADTVAHPGTWTGPARTRCAGVSRSPRRCSTPNAATRGWRTSPFRSGWTTSRARPGCWA